MIAALNKNGSLMHLPCCQLWLVICRNKGRPMQAFGCSGACLAILNPCLLADSGPITNHSSCIPGLQQRW